MMIMVIMKTTIVMVAMVIMLFVAHLLLSASDGFIAVNTGFLFVQAFICYVFLQCELG